MKLKKIFLFVALIFSINFIVNAQNIVNYFVDMPVYLLPSFDKTLKQELVENYQKNPERDSVDNLFGGKARLLQLDTITNNLKIQATSVSKLELQLIERADNSKIIGIINSVCSPICSSYVKFYDKNWNEIKVNLPSFTIENWLKSEISPEQTKLVKDLVQINFMEFSFSSDGKKLLISNRSSEHLTNENNKELAELVDFEKVIEVNFSDLVK